LDQVAERYPVVIHGVSMSVGSADPINVGYLAKLKRLARRVKSRWISDHLCWAGVPGIHSHDVLPMPYTDESLAHVVSRVRIIQDYLECPVFLENPSSHFAFTDSTWTECDFMAELSILSGCGLMLDLHSVFVSAFHHGFDALTYIDRIPADRVVQIQIAGQAPWGTHILDTTSNHVRNGEWELYRRVCERTDEISTLLEFERDEAIPAFDVVRAEALNARQQKTVTSTEAYRHGCSGHAA